MVNLPGTRKLALLLVSDSEDETFQIGVAFGTALRPGDCLLLSGDLGAGKTRLVHGISKAIESPIPARSPTFVIVNEYPGRIHLSHCDLYRVGSVEEVEELALDERLSKGALVVEWPEISGDLLIDDALFVRIENGDHENQRIISFTPTGYSAGQLLGRASAVYEALDASVGLDHNDK